MSGISKKRIEELEDKVRQLENTVVDHSMGLCFLFIVFLIIGVLTVYTFGTITIPYIIIWSESVEENTSYALGGVICTLLILGFSWLVWKLATFGY